MSDLGQPIVGFRFFYADEGGLLLPHRGYRTETSWVPGVNTAECLNFSSSTLPITHPAPDEQCGCGLHSFDSLAAMWSWAGSLRTFQPVVERAGFVLGATLSWGRVAIMEHSIAAQHAEIIALSVYEDGWLDRVELARRRYLVPLIPEGALETWSREFGVDVPDYLKPELSSA